MEIILSFCWLLLEVLVIWVFINFLEVLEMDFFMKKFCSGWFSVGSWLEGFERVLVFWLSY